VTIAMELDPTILRQLDTFFLRTRRSMLGIRQGAHRSQRRGHGVEFAEYRNYEVGDNPRYIDWGLYARSDKLYIRRYLEEENVALYIVIDGSNSMTLQGLRDKWELASTIATCAGYIALSTQDPVTISILGYSHSSPFWGARAFHAMQRFVSDVTTSLPEQGRTFDLLAESRRAAYRAKFPGICVYISDFLYPVEQIAETLAAFRSRNMEVHAVQVLGRNDWDPASGTDGATLTDSETGTSLPTALDEQARADYGKLLSVHNAAVRDYCLSHRVQFVSSRVEDSLAESAIDTLTRMSLFV